MGCGALPDAVQWGDAGASTLAHVAHAAGGLTVPTLEQLGLGLVSDIAGVAPVEQPQAIVARLGELSAGKDTTTGHWELMGLVVDNPFPVYPDGFPAAVLDAASRLTGHQFIGNRPASGTEIIEELGPEHLQSGALIVYTSADSVFQIAAHEDVTPVDELYRVCQVVRDEVLIGEHAVARVIARPFTGSKETGFTRTSRRHDYSLRPSGATALDVLTGCGVSTYGVGKVSDIFAGIGIGASYPTTSNADGMERVLSLASSVSSGVVFANLVDFDMVWGHRRDAIGYARALEEFDAQLTGLMSQLGDEDLLLITADHGCDPTHQGSDHTREYVPLLAWGPRVAGGYLGVLTTFATVAATVLHWFGISPVEAELRGLRYSWLGESILSAGSVPLAGDRCVDLPENVQHAAISVAARMPAGSDLYLVGGPVRDLLMGSLPQDIDFAFTGDVADLEGPTSPPGARIVSANPTLRTAHLLTGGVVSADIASTRAESYRADSAYPAAVPAPIEWDLARRDFSANALAVRIVDHGGATRTSFRISDVIDPHGGLSDIKTGTIRMLHEDSFLDDPSRILRAVRFARRFQWRLDPATASQAAAAIREGALAKLTPQQVAKECSVLVREGISTSNLYPCSAQSAINEEQ